MFGERRRVSNHYFEILMRSNSLFNVTKKAIDPDRT
jgi:hypothetical protein